MNHPLNVDCPKCGGVAGGSCHSIKHGMKMRVFHKERKVRANNMTNEDWEKIEESIKAFKKEVFGDQS